MKHPSQSLAYLLSLINLNHPILEAVPYQKINRHVFNLAKNVKPNYPKLNSHQGCWSILFIRIKNRYEKNSFWIPNFFFYVFILNLFIKINIFFFSRCSGFEQICPLKATKGASGFKFPIFGVFKVQQLELDTAQRRKLEEKASQIWAIGPIWGNEGGH
jgi:hypothetical protein